MQGQEAVGALAAHWLRLAGSTDVQGTAQHLQLAPLGPAGGGPAAALNSTLLGAAATQQPLYDQLQQALASQLQRARLPQQPATTANTYAVDYANAQPPRLLHGGVSEAAAFREITSLLPPETVLMLETMRQRQAAQLGQWSGPTGGARAPAAGMGGSSLKKQHRQQQRHQHQQRQQQQQQQLEASNALLYNAMLTAGRIPSLDHASPLAAAHAAIETAAKGLGAHHLVAAAPNQTAPIAAGSLPLGLNNPFLYPSGAAATAGGWPKHRSSNGGHDNGRMTNGGSANVMTGPPLRFDKSVRRPRSRAPAQPAEVSLEQSLQAAAAAATASRQQPSPAETSKHSTQGPSPADSSRQPSLHRSPAENITQPSQQPCRAEASKQPDRLPEAGEQHRPHRSPAENDDQPRAPTLPPLKASAAKQPAAQPSAAAAPAAVAMVLAAVAASGVASWPAPRGPGRLKARKSAAPRRAGDSVMGACASRMQGLPPAAGATCWSGGAWCMLHEGCCRCCCTSSCCTRVKAAASRIWHA
jgi:hypothetical protein